MNQKRKADVDSQEPEGGIMLNVIDVANYFLKKDRNRKLFKNDIIGRNGKAFCEGNVRLSIYLHIAQNVWIAKTGEKLIDVDFYACDNGATSLDVRDNYQIMLRNIRKILEITFPKEQKEFLDTIYVALKSADIDELIEISREDPEWEDKHKNYPKDKQKMDSLKLKDHYKTQYANFVWAIGRKVI